MSLVYLNNCSVDKTPEINPPSIYSCNIRNATLIKANIPCSVTMLQSSHALNCKCSPRHPARTCTALLNIMHMPIQFLAKVNICRTDILYELYGICGPALQIFAHASFHLIQIALYGIVHLLQILAAFAAGDKLLNSSKLTGCRSGTI